jgi:phage gp29-like protein
MAKRTARKTIPIIQNIHITQARRTNEDINSWRTAIKTAENVYNPRRALLYDLYEEILLDGHLSAIIEKRKLAVSNTPIVFIENGEEDETLTALTETEDFINLLHYILESKLWGHSLIEMDFTNGGLKPTLIPRKHVEPKKGIILHTQYETNGFSYREAPYTNYLIEVGYTDTLGILLKAAQYAIYKRGGFGDWGQYVELFGMPFRIGKYDGFDEKTRSELQTALNEAGSAACVVIPKEADFEFIQNGTSGSSTLYETLINVCNKELSKLILGQTLTTEAGGSMAQAKVHQEVELEIHYADKLFVKNVLNDKLVPLLKMHGYNIGNGKFQFNQQENIDLKTRLDMDLKLAEKIAIDDSYFYETYNVPVPAKAGLTPTLSKGEGAKASV